MAKSTGLLSPAACNGITLTFKWIAIGEGDIVVICGGDMREKSRLLIRQQYYCILFIDKYSLIFRYSKLTDGNRVG